MAARRRKKSTRKGQIRKTSRRAYRGLSKKKVQELEKRNLRLRQRLRDARAGNPFPHGPHIKTELEAYAFVAAGGAASGWLASQLAAWQADGIIPALPGGIKPEWALTGLTILAPAMGWVKGANGARMALASSGMAAAQASDFFSK